MISTPNTIKRLSKAGLFAKVLTELYTPTCDT